MRLARPTTTENLAGKFERGVGYRYAKSLYTQDWFDSGTERDVANILDGADDVELLAAVADAATFRSSGPKSATTTLTSSRSRTMACTAIVEVKMQKEMTSIDVQGKRRPPSAGSTTSTRARRSSASGRTCSSARTT